MSEPERKDFFISYNQADEAWAVWIAWELEEANFKVILQAWDFHAGSNFVLEMQRAAEISDHTIAVLSPDYLTALYTQPEWAAAFSQDPKGEKGALIPVRVKKCELKGLLKPIIYIDLFDKIEENAARNTLLTGVKRQRRKPGSPPPFSGARQVSEKPRFPGALPSIWNLSHNRNPNFTGREALLEKLHQALAQGQGAALTQAFAGLGGVGKTQMAVEYAYRFSMDYEIVWWLRAEDAATLAGDYAKLANELNLPEKDAAQQEVIVSAVRQRLGQLGKWLLVFDNANDPKEIRAYLPQGGAGHIIITSRNQVWGGLGKVVKVQEWEPGEAQEFILKRTRQTDTAAAAALAQELGHLPLALEQAGAYIEECGCGIAQYLALFRERRQELLQRGELSQDYPDTVATTWEMSFEKVQQEAPAAADLLNLCAFLAPDDIPLEMLKMGAKHLPERLAQAVHDPLAWNEVRAALRRYSLMEMTGDALSMHRLVQAVVRDRLDDEGKKEWAGAAVEVVDASLAHGVTTNVEIWPWYARLVPHAWMAAGQAEVLQVASKAAGRSLNQVGLYLQIRAEFAEAKKALERSLVLSEAIHGVNHPEVAIRVNNLGTVLKDLRDLAGAKTNFERALAIMEKVYGHKHHFVATTANNLGYVLRVLGDLTGAMANYERALAIDEATYGPNHPEVATDVNNLGFVLQNLGDLAGAKAHYERALAIDEAAYGPNHPEVATDVNNLGRVLQDLGDLAGARAHYERALAILRQFLGEEHPNTKIVKDNLSSLDSAEK